MHAGPCGMCIHEWKPEEGHWVSCTSILTPGRQSLTEGGAVPLLTPSYLAGQQPQGSRSSNLFLPPPTLTPIGVVTGVCSDVRVLGN